MKRFWGGVWPAMSVLAGVAGALLLSPADPPASWWPAAEWARHALTGVGVGLVVLLIGEVLGLFAGTIGLPGGWSLRSGTGNGNGSAGDLSEIRSQLSDVNRAQMALTATATEALTLSRTAMEMLLGSKLPSKASPAGGQRPQESKLKGGEPGG